MALTLREITNRVLQVLGEDDIDPVASVIVDPYEKLIATFVNQIKEEVEDAHNWRGLIAAKSVTIAASGTLGALSGTNNRSRLVRHYDPIRGIQDPLVNDVTDTSAKFPLHEVPLARLLQDRAQSAAGTTGVPYEFAIDLFPSSSDEAQLNIFPAADKSRNYTVSMYLPQTRIGFDALDTEIQVPARPIELGALWYALEERGEELGAAGVFSERKYRQALDDAISSDAAESGGFQLVPV